MGCHSWEGGYQLAEAFVYLAVDFASVILVASPVASSTDETYAEMHGMTVENCLTLV